MTRAKMSAWLVFKRPTQETVVQPYWLPIVCVWLCVCVFVCVSMCFSPGPVSPGSPSPKSRPMLSCMGPLPAAVVHYRAAATQYRVDYWTEQSDKWKADNMHACGWDTHTHARAHTKHGETIVWSLCSLFFSLGVRLFEQIHLLLQTFIENRNKQKK